MCRAAGRVLPSTREYSERPSAVTSGATGVPISAGGPPIAVGTSAPGGRGLMHSALTHLQRARVVAGGIAVADPPLQRAELGHLREYSEYAEGTHSTPADPSLLVGRSHAARRWLSATMLPVVRCMWSGACCMSSVVRCTLSAACCLSQVVGWRPPSSAAVGENSARCCSRQRCIVRASAMHTRALHRRPSAWFALRPHLADGTHRRERLERAAAHSGVSAASAVGRFRFRKFPRSGGSGFGRFRIRQFPDSEVSGFERFRFRTYPDLGAFAFGTFWKVPISEVSASPVARLLPTGAPSGDGGGAWRWLWAAVFCGGSEGCLGQSFARKCAEIGAECGRSSVTAALE